MENRYSNCFFNFEVVGLHSECDRLNCKGNHSPVFTIYREKPHGFDCYCFNRKQLGRYWRCIVEDCKFMCPSECEHCSIFRETSRIFVELQEACFFQPNLICRLHLKKCLCNLYCGVFLIETLIKTILLLRLKLQNQFRISALLQIMGRHVDRKFIVHLIKGYYKEKKNHYSLC